MTETTASVEDVRVYVPAALGGGGVLLFTSHIGINLAKGPEQLTPMLFSLVGVHFVLAGTVAACGFWLAISDLPTKRYGRIAGWCLGGAGLFLLLHTPIIALRTDLVTAGVWAQSAISFGAASGVVGGLIEAQTIERARAAERESVRAETAETQVEQLEYLNTLLRHEVLNNANVINGYTELALAESDEAVEDYLTTIRRQSEDMSTVVTDVRVLIEALQDDDSYGRTNLSTVLADEVNDVRATYEDVEVEMTIPGDVYVLADDLVARVFGNLLSNAVEHNDSSTPRVTVTVGQSPETVTIDVSDNGPGVPAGRRSTVFDNGDGGDHGVGLYLVRLLVDRYDGSIELTETGPDGSVFTVELPRARGDSNRPDRPNQSNRSNRTAAQ